MTKKILAIVLGLSAWIAGTVAATVGQSGTAAAQTLFKSKGTPIEFGVVRPGLLADLAIVDQNPIENLKALYGVGAMKLNDQTGKVEWVGGVKWTIKDGIVYDAKKLRDDVAKMADAQRKSRPATNNSTVP